MLRKYKTNRNSRKGRQASSSRTGTRSFNFSEWEVTEEPVVKMNAKKKKVTKKK